uniref:Uncharacterized protein n=1 Tax=Candidatus Kentrum sp. TC TaxID=2126339 RepID=A0A450YX38_9GAMM|nr:MAG: hypothetical protein BECKTC1821E_GA0114239_105923 [Candidatus Kentron sp. TC]
MDHTKNYTEFIKIIIHSVKTAQNHGNNTKSQLT